MLYILDGKLAVPCEDAAQWAEWLESANRVVRKSLIEGVEVSTVFLGVNLRHGTGEPLLFETMVFGEDAEALQFEQGLGRDSFWGCAKRDACWAEAELTHRIAVEEIRARQEEARMSAVDILFALCVPSGVGQ